MNPRVAIICEFPTLNGGENSLLAALPHLIAAGWTPIALCPPTGDLAQAFQGLGVQLEPFRPRGTPREASQAELASILRRISPAILHANSLSMGRLSGPVVQELGLPSLSHLRDIVSLSAAAVADLNHHTRLLAVSAATRAAHVRQGLDPEKTRVLYNGVDLTAFTPAPPQGWLHCELGIPTSAILIGSIGQIILRKGQDVLAAAAKLLAEHLPDVHYVFLGARHSAKPETRRFEADLREVFSQPPLAAQGHFLGVRRDVPSILRELTVLVHPARQEPLGRVLLEGAASGSAIVATAVGGTEEIFPADSNAAILVAPNDPVQLAAALGRVLCDDALRSGMGQRARRRAEEDFDAGKSAQGLIQHYNEVVS